MLLTPTPETHNDREGQTSATPVEGATLVVERPTAEAAIAEVHDRLGADAQILEARRVARGGIGGFFAKEVVEIHAAPAKQDGPARQAAPRTDERPAVGSSMTDGSEPRSERSPIDRVLAGAEHTTDALDFATFLREQLADGGLAASTGTGAIAPPSEPSPPEVAPVRWPDAATGTTGDTPVVRPKVTATEERPAWADTLLAAASEGTREAAAAGDTATDPATGQASPADEPPAADDGGPAWSVTALLRLGLPSELVRSIEVADPADDVAWTMGLATALRPLCRPLPSGRSLLVGPRARSLAGAIGVEATPVGQPIKARGDVAAPVGRGVAGLAWLERVRDDRWIHLVVGGVGWREVLHTDPLAVSWASDDDLAEAIRCAIDLGLVLGHGPLGAAVGRARPLDVALAIRDQVPTR